MTLALLMWVLAAAPVSAAAPKYEDTESSVVLVAPAKVTAGASAQADIEITLKPGFHLNEEYPINFKPLAAAGVTFAKAKVEKKDMALKACADHAEQQCSAKVPVAFTAAKTGATSVGGTLSYAACDPNVCLIKKVPLTVALDVK